MEFCIVVVEANVREVGLWAVPERVEAERGLKVRDDNAVEVDVGSALAVDKEPETGAVGEVAGGDADGVLRLALEVKTPKYFYGGIGSKEDGGSGGTVQVESAATT